MVKENDYPSWALESLMYQGCGTVGTAGRRVRCWGSERGGAEGQKVRGGAAAGVS